MCACVYVHRHRLQRILRYLVTGPTTSPPVGFRSYIVPLTISSTTRCKLRPSAVSNNSDGRSRVVLLHVGFVVFTQCKHTNSPNCTLLSYLTVEVRSSCDHHIAQQADGVQNNGRARPKGQRQHLYTSSPSPLAACAVHPDIFECCSTASS